MVFIVIIKSKYVLECRFLSMNMIIVAILVFRFLVKLRFPANTPISKIKVEKTIILKILKIIYHAQTVFQTLLR